MKKTITLTIISALLLCSCLKQNYAESSSVMSPDKSELFVAADVFTGDSELEKTIKITSNRSWSAHLNDLDSPIDETDPTQSVPWGSVSTTYHQNVMNVTDEVDLIVSFERNYSRKPINGVLNIYSEGKLQKAIKLTQAGMTPILSVSCDQTTPISDEGMILSMNVLTNSNWTATIDKSSTANAKLLNGSGFDPGIVQLSVRSNEEKTVKNLRVVVSVDGCEDKVFDFTQSSMNPSAKVFECPFKFTSHKLSGTDYRPIIVKDNENLDQGIKDLGVKCYYEVGKTCFDEVEDPTELSEELPESGFACLPSTLLRSDSLFVKVMCSVDGYRKSYYKLFVRAFQFGLNYFPEYYPSSGTSTKLFPLVFEDISFSSAPGTNPGWKTRMRIDQNAIVTYIAKYGDKGAFFTQGYCPQQSTHKVTIGETLTSHPMLGTSSEQEVISTPSTLISKGQSFLFQIGSEYYIHLNKLVYLEQFKY